jgi:hypothetical protein
MNEVEPAQSPTVMIATPMYGGMCCAAYVHGLLSTINVLGQLGIKVFWSQTTNESLITRGRNELVRVFMEAEYDYLMFVDADIAFDGAGVMALIQGDRDIACGIYPKKEVDWARVHRAVLDGATADELRDYAGAFVFNFAGGEDQETDEQGFIEVRHGGTGFMLIKRRVFEDLAEHVPEYRVGTTKRDGEYLHPLCREYFDTSIDASGALLSEDYHFCELWRKHGGMVHANPLIKLEHVGTFQYGGVITKSGGNLK